MKILVTAFEPFGGSQHNSSLDTLRSLPSATPEGHTVVKAELPVVYDRCGDALREAVNQHKPDAVVCLGQAEGRGSITPEYVAVNVKHNTSPDNDGNVFVCAPILADAPDAYITTLPVTAMVDKMKQSGIPASVSFTAGAYVCNNLMYHALHLCKPLGIPAGFIHMPLSYEIAAAESKAGRVLTLPQDVLTRGITLCLDCIG
ncbi:MAG: pyroglutamyl-peptidase I [Clostridia bacterium]|nr:pyroglutamyl-peptidase I [Clostridia bacterium]